MSIIFIVLLILLIVLFGFMIRIVSQQEVKVVERFGKYHRTMSPGLNLMIPFVEMVRKTHDLRIQLVNVPPQSVITKDNVQVTIGTAIFYKIIKPEQATYGIADMIAGVKNITAATMRQILGKMELDETLSGREQITKEIREALDEATTNWGVLIERVEVLDINPPHDIQDAMDKQMKAERQKRAIILEAEAAKQDIILRAEGDRQSRILRAEAEREARIREAEGVKKAKELESEGEAAAITSIARAEQQRIQMLSRSGLNEQVLAYKSFEALQEMAKGSANKIFLPSKALDTMSSIGAMAELLKEQK